MIVVTAWMMVDLDGPSETAPPQVSTRFDITVGVDGRARTGRSDAKRMVIEEASIVVLVR